MAARLSWKKYFKGLTVSGHLNRLESQQWPPLTGSFFTGGFPPSVVSGSVTQIARFKTKHSKTIQSNDILSPRAEGREILKGFIFYN